MKSHLLSFMQRFPIAFTFIFFLATHSFNLHARTVTWSGPASTFVSNTIENVTLTVSGGGYATKTISCISSSSQQYYGINGSAAYSHFNLNTTDEKIDSIKIVWTSNTSNHYIPIIYGESTTFSTIGGVGSIVTATNGGITTTATLATSGINNCPGEIIKFPSGINVSSIYVARNVYIDGSAYEANVLYPTFRGRINSSSGVYTTLLGSSSTVYIAEITLYISDIVITIPLSTPSAQAATSINSSGFTANWTAVDNATSYTVKIYKGANEIISARKTNIIDTNVAISDLDINTTYTYTVTAIGDGITYGNSAVSSPITVRTLNTAKAITSFSLVGAIGIIDENAKTITVEVPFSTDLSSPLTPTVIVSEYAALVTSGAQQFIAETPITFTVQAEDGSTQDYTVTVRKATVNKNADLSNIEVSLGTLNPAFSADVLNYTVQLPYANTTIPTVTATKADYRANVVITDATTLPGTTTVLVTAEDVNITKTYTINFTKAAPSTACAITGFSINGVAGVLNESEKTITVTLPGLSTNVTALVPTINISALATISPASGVTQDFTTPKDYTITAQDITITKTYSVIVVLVNDSFNGPFPYISAMTPTYQVPFWITGYETYDAERVVEGGCKTENGTIRLGAQSSSYNQLKLKVASCGTFKVGLSASGARTISLTNNKNSVIASTTLSSDICKILEATVNSNVETELYINILSGTGGTNVHSIEITSYGTSALTEKESISSVAVQENNLLVTAEVGSKVTVLAINGNSIYETMLKTQEYKIPVFLNRGCYIVRINHEVYKILIK
jgi:hypothetical protein